MPRCQNAISLKDLPRDVLLEIFAYCDFQTLLNLAQVCRYFNIIASQDSLWRPIIKKCVNANGHWKSTSNKTGMTLKDYCRLSFNWARGLYSETVLVDFRTRLLPWLQLSKNKLFLSEGNEIKIFNIYRRKRKVSKPICSIYCGKDDVTRFIARKDMIVTGAGKIVRVWQIKNDSCSKGLSFCGHTNLISCVDSWGGFIFSGSKDGTIKIWSLGHYGGCLKTILVGDPVRSIVMNPNKRTFAAGSSGFLNDHVPLRVYDCETGSDVGDLCCESSGKRGAGVVDIKYDSPSVLLSCGYDTAVRIWDLRNSSRRCVKTWEDPHDSTIYCIDSDKEWTILSGTNRYGLVRMWDKRMDRCVNYYNVSQNTCTRSPVYSLKFNKNKLFVALDNRVNVLNFEPH